MHTPPGRIAQPGYFFARRQTPRRHCSLIGPQPPPRLSGLRLRLPPDVALGAAAEAPIDPRQPGLDQSRLQRAAVRQLDHGHDPPPASAARRLYLDHLPHQQPGQIAGLVAVGLAKLWAVHTVEPHGH